MSQIDKLTPEQEVLIPVYREKWRKVALSTERIDREKAAEVIKDLYASINKEEPKIIFYESPYLALRSPEVNQMRCSLRSELDKQLTPIGSLWDQIRKQFTENLWNQLAEDLNDQLESQVQIELQDKLNSQMWNELTEIMGFRTISELLNKSLNPEQWIPCGSLYDFCISEFSFFHNSDAWKLYQSFVKSCGWIFPFAKLCIVCDRPRILKFDSENRLHAEGEPAIQFADGYSLYSHHGVALPEKYGKVHPHQWQSEWLLTESNAELRRVLIQGIGYARICQELQAVELDTWREYTLLKIAADADVEPIYLLKMTCPSTGHIHALRVPPAMTTAREAIRWVNWDIDPEAFAVQT